MAALIAVILPTATANGQAPATATTTATPATTYYYPQQAASPPTYTYQQPTTTPTYSYAAQPTYTYQSNYAQAGAGYTYQQQPAATTYAASGSAGFLSWLNGVRAQYGLPAVGYDANLENWAAQNSAAQASRGLGHFVMGPARRQNSAMGNMATIGAQWLASPAHRAALLDPTIRAIGLAGYGAYWTFNAY